jgi:hypothetical protein
VLLPQCVFVSRTCVMPPYTQLALRRICFLSAHCLQFFVPAFANVPIGLVRSSVGGQVRMPATASRTSSYARFLSCPFGLRAPSPSASSALRARRPSKPLAFLLRMRRASPVGRTRRLSTTSSSCHSRRSCSKAWCGTRVSAALKLPRYPSRC